MLPNSNLNFEPWKVWLVATGREEIALNKFLNFLEATSMGVIFRVRDYRFMFNLKTCKKNVHLCFCFIELHCHELGKSLFEEVPGRMVLTTDLSCYHNVQQKLHCCLNRFYFVIIIYILSEFNWWSVPGTSHIL